MILFFKKEISNNVCYFCLKGDQISIFISLVEIALKEFNDVKLSINKYKV